MWKAQYATTDGKLCWEVECESKVCPVSELPREAFKRIERFFEARRVREAQGGILYGSDSSLWPARWFDIVSLIQEELDREKHAFEAAKVEYLRSHPHG